MAEKMTDRLQVLITDDMRENLELAREGSSVGPIVRRALENYLGMASVKRKIAKARRES